MLSVGLDLIELQGQVSSLTLNCQLMKNFIVNSVLILIFTQSFAQLKAESFLCLDSTNYKIIANNGSNGLKGVTILDSKFKYEKSLNFISLRKVMVQIIAVTIMR